MTRLAAMKALVSAAEGGGFAAAGRALGLSRAQVSRQVAGLETHLGTRLVTRRTRAFALTEAGHAYVQQARAILADLGAADAAARPASGGITGLLRVAAPAALGRHYLAGLTVRFMAGHPQLRVALALDDRFIDADEEGFDVLVCVAAGVPASGARQLAALRQALTAAPAYLAAHGRPQVPGDLAIHRLLHCGASRAEARWALRGGGGPESLAINPALRSNAPEAVREAALAGLGIALLPAFVTAEAVAAGRLASVLEGFVPAPLGLYAMLPPERPANPRASAFLAFLTSEFARRPPG